MKTLTITAIMAALVAIPIMVRKHAHTIAEQAGAPSEEDKRYDLFDFTP